MRKITAETTFAELKEMVPDASKERTPVGKTLIKSDEPVLIRVKEGSGTVTVYKNGFFVYSEGEVHTARAVANCRVMKYPKAEGKPEEVKEEVFKDLPFPMVLSHFGMVNLEDQKAKSDGYHHGISLDGEEIRMEENLCVPDFTESLNLDGDGDIWEKRREMLPEALASLTEKQRDIIELYFFKEMKQGQIAESVGVSQPYVAKAIKRGLEILKKSLSE